MHFFIPFQSFFSPNMIFGHIFGFALPPGAWGGSNRKIYTPGNLIWEYINTYVHTFNGFKNLLMYVYKNVIIKISPNLLSGI